MSIACLTIPGSAVACSQCLALMTKGLEELDGIESILVDTQANILSVNYRSDMVSEDIIRAKLRSLGFSGKQLYCIC